MLNGNPPAAVASLTVKSLDDHFDSPLIFSALPKEAAITRELELAAAGHVVCTNASANRMLPDVPLLLPEVNAETHCLDRCATTKSRLEQRRP